jgi:DNA-binding response OmpR family regulator
MDDESGIFPNVLWSRIREAEREAPADRPIVLVIEDDPSAQMLSRYALRNVERTDAASTVTDALRMAESVPYDGLLVDLRLPDGMGTEVVEELREQTPYWGVPMVAVTSHSLPEGSGPFLDAGFDAYVAKPFEQDELRTLVQHLVVDPDDAVDKGRKLVRKEASQRSAQGKTSERDEETLDHSEEISTREESRRDPPATIEMDAIDS